MAALLLYLLKANGGFLLVYLLYRLVLRPTTFYSLNRLFLAGGVVLSMVVPLVNIAPLFQDNQQIIKNLPSFTYSWDIPAPVATPAATVEVGAILLSLFWAGVGVMTARLLVQLVSLLSLHQKSSRDSYQGIPFRRLHEPVPPFSFWRNIYFNPAQHHEQNWLPILQHEQTHVQQWHTLDILLMEMTALVHWFNPAVWLLRTALKQNLEFLTDQQTLEAGFNRKQYQYSLVQTGGTPPFTLTSSFSYHSLKNRISMMNKAPSARIQLLRFLAVTPLLLLGLVACQGIEEPASVSPKTGTEASQKPLTTEEQNKAFKPSYQSVAKFTLQKDTLVLDLVSGETEKYPNSPEGLAAIKQKYGITPSLLPPPPPPAREAALAPPPPPPPYTTNLPQEFLTRNPTVKGIGSSEGTIYVILKNDDVESFDTTPAGMAAFEKKYGALPPPPPPVRAQKKTLPKQ